MNRFVVYIAMSLDGFIADADGGVGWLDSFECDEYGYEGFLDLIGSIVVGRVTYEQIAGFGQWPYGDIPALVWSGSELDDLPAAARNWSGNPDDAAMWLTKQAQGKDVWVLGGARTINSFLEAGMIDLMEIFVIPVLLGGGIRLFEGNSGGLRLLNLENAQPYANGVVKLSHTMR